MKKILLILSVLFCGTYIINAQNSYDLVYTILNTKCSNGTCHSAISSSSNLMFDGSSTDVYNAILNVNPANTTAHRKYNKLVYQNQPYESFLLRKLGNAYDTDLAIEATEGSPMNDINGNPLSVKEMELIRQWIMNGAKITGNTVDTALINSYYDDPNKAPFISKPMVDPFTQKRVRFGPVFVPAGSASEIEYLLKNNLHFDYNTEITQISGKMNNESHHFLLFKFDDSLAAAAQPNGMRVVSLLGGTTSFDGNKNLTGAWQDDATFNLPQGTAIFWNKTTPLDLNYHIKNYNPTGVIPCDFYLVVSYKERLPNTTTIEMKSELQNNAALVLFNGNNERFYNDKNNGNNETRNIWMISSHTHQWGKGFNIYKGTGGTPIDTIYQGTIDYNTGIDFGTYDWEHPSIRYFDPLYPVNMKTEGIRAWTKWNNTKGSIITFGFTTNDEMQLFYYMYTLSSNQVGIEENKLEADVDFFPNPMTENAVLKISNLQNEDISVNLVDITGSEIATVLAKENISGTAYVSLSREINNLNKGVYFAVVKIGDKSITKKIIVSE